jgi:FAD/FMN-containing dehydrogenase
MVVLMDQFVKGFLTYLIFFLLTSAHAAEISHFCEPSQPCWPSAEEWQLLGKGLVGKLEVPQTPLRFCQLNPQSDECLRSLSDLKDPFSISNSSGGTQSSGWLGAWTSSLSAYSIAAENANDIIMAVQFARAHNIRLVIKSTGHDYLGRSNAPDSLLVWTHKMQKITMVDSFIPKGCQSNSHPGVPAVTAESGVTWFDAYQEVTVRNARYVQGGGCTSVGVAGGFMQGGGFGSWSKKYGTGAANMLEAEIITAEGKLLVVNDCQHEDLFWALRGGGGGTFGIVTKVVLRTHELPNYFGIMNGKIQANSDALFQELLEQFIDFYYTSLNNEHWGEQIKINDDNSVDLMLASQGLSTEEAEKIWKPFREWINERKSSYTMNAEHIEIPGEKMWNAQFIKEIPGAIIIEANPEMAAERFWWAFDAGQVATYWYAFQSSWVPLNLFEKSRSKDLAKKLYEASRHWPISLQFNKALAGAATDAIERSKETSMNPAVFKAAALLIVSASTHVFPKPSEGEYQRSQVNAAMEIMREIIPANSGTYLNEADFFEVNWQRQFWGINYERILEIKNKYDPESMFICHHCVGSP